MTDSLPPEVTEIAMVSTNAVGYFAQPEHADDLDHGKRGAYGQWSAINEDTTIPQGYDRVSQFVV